MNAPLAIRNLVTSFRPREVIHIPWEMKNLPDGTRVPEIGEGEPCDIIFVKKSDYIPQAYEAACRIIAKLDAIAFPKLTLRQRLQGKTGLPFYKNDPTDTDPTNRYALDVDHILRHTTEPRSRWEMVQVNRLSDVDIHTRGHKFFDVTTPEDSRFEADPTQSPKQRLQATINLTMEIARVLRTAMLQSSRGLNPVERTEPFPEDMLVMVTAIKEMEVMIPKGHHLPTQCILVRPSAFSNGSVEVRWNGELTTLPIASSLLRSHAVKLDVWKPNPNQTIKINYRVDVVDLNDLSPTTLLRAEAWFQSSKDGQAILAAIETAATNRTARP